jgi:peptide chain release factor subunit 1
MASTAPAPDRVRRLSELRADRPVVLSLYLDLDPAEFAAPPARESAVRSLINEARKQIEAPEVDHEDQKVLRAGLERAETFLQNDLPTEGVRSLAVFVSEPLGLFESIALPQPLPNRIALGHTPLVAPLAEPAIRERWCVVLVNRDVGRVLVGDRFELAEAAELKDDTHGQHQQGGWSQARYQRAVEKEVEEHFRAVAERVVRLYDRSPFHHLLIGCPHELLGDFRSELRTDVADRFAGELDVDVATASADDVRAAMAPILEEHDERLEREAFERLGGPLTANGTGDVLQALNERRVETLMIDDTRSEPGRICPACGLLGTAGAATCPADGTATDEVEDLREPAIELALQQDAAVLPIRRRTDQLRAAGGMAALLRF